MFYNKVLNTCLKQFGLKNPTLTIILFFIIKITNVNNPTKKIPGSIHNYRIVTIGIMNNAQSKLGNAINNINTIKINIKNMR